ncbi:hypothetical protein SAMN05216503_2212 [Polaribacter sp. KT25b]|nr:hypothetical protein SAMN05216503_2212 [Polaribacter sp. KT25b]
MYKDTLQQIIFFIISSVVFFKTGKALITLNGINSFLDFGIIMLFFVSFVFFINFLLRLFHKLINAFSF